MWNKKASARLGVWGRSPQIRSEGAGEEDSTAVPALTLDVELPPNAIVGVATAVVVLLNEN